MLQPQVSSTTRWIFPIYTHDYRMKSFVFLTVWNMFFSAFGEPHRKMALKPSEGNFIFYFSNGNVYRKLGRYKFRTVILCKFLKGNLVSDWGLINEEEEITSHLTWHKIIHLFTELNITSHPMYISFTIWHTQKNKLNSFKLFITSEWNLGLYGNGSQNGHWRSFRGRFSKFNHFLHRNFNSSRYIINRQD